MVPTYFRRELRDRALQRQLWPRTFVFCRRVYCGGFFPPPSYPAKAGYPVRRGFAVRSRVLWNTGSPAFAGDDSEAGDESEMLRRMSEIPASASKADLRASALAVRDALDNER